MKKNILLIMALSLSPTLLLAQDKIRFIPRTEDLKMEAIRERNKTLTAKEDSLSTAMEKAIAAKKEAEQKSKPRMRVDTEKLKRPEKPEDFKQIKHFAPVSQYNTGTCWSFSATSLIESDIMRLTGKEIKLSEMHTVYYEYLAKAEGFIDSRGDSFLGEGSQMRGALRMIKKHGIVPEETYPGNRWDPDHNHELLFDEINDYLHFCKEKNRWDKTVILPAIEAILQKYLGKPPVQFNWEGKEYTPHTFRDEFLKINPDDYVDLISTMSFPFYQFGKFDVPDNWWHDSAYYNVPLEEWYTALQKAVQAGYSAGIGGDVSEPGFYGEEDIAIIPDFDIPYKNINQDAREYRIYNESTSDDHGIHIVGYTKHKGMDWYLIKDSSRGARYGNFEGYMFYREDYIKLKMLGYTIHKDAVKELLKKQK
ncbi:MAG TPA: peptidase C1 [Candidatus Marinimicrobia bacterium]|nr:peptidase C1 [Candidatus Neomarinimicrobiota bacterium]